MVEFWIFSTSVILSLYRQTPVYVVLVVVFLWVCKQLQTKYSVNRTISLSYQLEKLVTTTL